MGIGPLDRLSHQEEHFWLLRMGEDKCYDSDVKSSQVSLGKGINLDHFSWRHSCVSIDFIEGNTKLFENGRKIFEKYGVADMQRAYEQNKKEIDIISVG